MRYKLLTFISLMLCVILMAIQCELGVKEEKPLERQCYQIDNIDTMHQVEYVGNWVHMTQVGQTGSYAKNETDTIIIRACGYQYGIYTELAVNHTGYKVFVNDEYDTTINTYSDTFVLDSLTYVTDSLPDKNNVIKLVPDSGYFTFNGWEKCFHPSIVSWNDD